jgi:epoxyqueuosine reductase
MLQNSIGRSINFFIGQERLHIKTSVHRQWNAALLTSLQAHAKGLGFSSLGISDVLVAEASDGLRAWLAAGFHGTMNYMARHEALRNTPAALVPGTVSAVMVTMNYAPATDDWLDQAWDRLATPDQAYIAKYALGRDYHKVMRANLQRLAEFLQIEVGELGFRVFCDSAPVMEVTLANKAGLGWRGKNTLLLSRKQGSMFFIGTLYTDLPLSSDALESQVAPDALPDEHCGSCVRCVDVCPTKAIVAPYQLDARKCISYLTIEHKGSIPIEFRSAMGNRIYGCDDCQLVCPWNKYAQAAAHPDFVPRHQLDNATLLTLFSWTESEFNQRMAGSAIYRIGYWRWLRNIAVGLGNALAATPDVVKKQTITSVLMSRRAVLSTKGNEQSNEQSDEQSDEQSGEQALLTEHIDWALAQ